MISNDNIDTILSNVSKLSVMYKDFYATVGEIYQDTLATMPENKDVLKEKYDDIIHGISESGKSIQYLVAVDKFYKVCSGYLSDESKKEFRRGKAIGNQIILERKNYAVDIKTLSEDELSELKERINQEVTENNVPGITHLDTVSKKAEENISSITAYTVKVKIDIDDSLSIGEEYEEAIFDEKGMSKEEIYAAIKKLIESKIVISINGWEER
jgi:hypothetical protein